MFTAQYKGISVQPEVLRCTMDETAYQVFLESCINLPPSSPSSSVPSVTASSTADPANADAVYAANPMSVTAAATAAVGDPASPTPAANPPSITAAAAIYHPANATSPTGVHATPITSPTAVYVTANPSKVYTTSTVNPNEVHVAATPGIYGANPNVYAANPSIYATNPSVYATVYAANPGFYAANPGGYAAHPGVSATNNPSVYAANNPSIYATNPSVYATVYAANPGFYAANPGGYAAHPGVSATNNPSVYAANNPSIYANNPSVYADNPSVYAADNPSVYTTDSHVPASSSRTPVQALVRFMALSYFTPFSCCLQVNKYVHQITQPSMPLLGKRKNEEGDEGKKVEATWRWWQINKPVQFKVLLICKDISHHGVVKFLFLDHEAMEELIATGLDEYCLKYPYASRPRKSPSVCMV